jgi:hypothetical protein
MCRVRSSGRLTNAARKRGPASRGEAGRTCETPLVASLLARVAVPLAVFLVACVPAQAGAATRIYSLTYSGFQSESFSASDSTCCGIHPAGYVGCAYTEDGDITVHWRDVWRVTADVHPKSGHVKIKAIKLLSGPKDRKHPGDSEISGKTGNSNGNSQCSTGGLAGSYDCTAEAVTPISVSTPTFTPAKKAFVLKVDGFVGRRAQYSGDSPPSLSCDQTIGSNWSPGGFLGGDVGGEYSFSAHRIPSAQIAALRVNQALRADALTTPYEAGWLSGDSFPKADTDCGLASFLGDTATCHYDSGANAPNRGALELFKRLK